MRQEMFDNAHANAFIAQQYVAYSQHQYVIFAHSNHSLPIRKWWPSDTGCARG